IGRRRRDDFPVALDGGREQLWVGRHRYRMAHGLEQENVVARIAVRSGLREVELELARELPCEAQLRGAERMRFGRLRQIDPVTLAAQSGANPPDAQMIGERACDWLDGAREQH